MDKLKKLYHGTCYYPELWDEEILFEDIEIMKKTGLNMVRIGEFWWSKIEPNQGEYNTDYIISLLNIFHKNNIDVVLCTPTPTPPIWITYRRDDLLHVDSKGNRMIHGSRQHPCTNNQEYRQHCVNIINKIAEAVANHPAVVLWQLDNEFKCHIRECFCEICKTQWHIWLKQKYGTIENLNDAWKTMIWSQTYQSFDQVPQPFDHTPFLHNASLLNAYKVFHREKIAEFATEHADTIRKFSKIPITTNGGMGFGIDNELLFKNLDFVGFDTYAERHNFHGFIMNCDIWRGIKKDKNFWLLETSTSHTGALERHSYIHNNGYLVSEAVSCFALGGASFTYWLWRQQQSGCEINHSAVISAWGKPSVGYVNVLEVEKARKELETFITSTDFTKAELAITYSDKARTFMETEPHKTNDYRGLMTHLYSIILKTGIHRDLLPENQDVFGYKILMTPFMFHVSDEYLERAKTFVENGGIWIVGPVTGGRTKEHTIITEAALGKKLEQLAGVEGLFTYPIEHSETTGVAFDIEAPLALWSTLFDLKGATAMGYTKGGQTPDLSFITENKVGKGKIVMVGSLPIEENGDLIWEKLIDHYAEESGIIVKYNVSKGTVAIPRHDEKNKYIVLVNMNGNGGIFELEQFAIDVLTKEELKPSKVIIDPFSYKVIKLT